MNEAKPTTIRERIDALYARYPHTKYIWVLPRIDMAQEIPEHIDLAVFTRAISTNTNDGQIYEISKNQWALAKPALMGLAADAGIVFRPEYNRRVDDGSNPDIVEWQATAAIVGISGIMLIPANKRVDFAHLRASDEMRLRARSPREIWLNGKSIQWSNATNEERERWIEQKLSEADMQRRGFGIELAESKAQLRAIRSVLGIPQKFDIETLRDKQFATLRIILAPKPVSEAERLMVLQSTMERFFPAYPSGESQRPVQVGTVEQPRQLEERQQREPLRLIEEARAGKRREEPEEVEVTEVFEGEEIVAAPQRPSPAGEVVQPTAQPALPLGAVPTPAGSSLTQSAPAPAKSSTKKSTFAVAMGELRARLIKALGEEQGEGVFREAIGAKGFARLEEVTDSKQQAHIFRDLSARVRELEAGALKQTEQEVKPLPEQAPAEKKSSLEEIIETRRASFERMAIERITDHLDELLKTCPLDKLPETEAVVIEIIQSGDKARMIDLAMKIVRANLLETMRIREEAFQKVRGGKK